MSVAAQYLEVQQGSANELVRAHAPLVKRIAWHLKGRLPASVELGDLVQAGMIGLLEAARNFAPGRAANLADLPPAYVGVAGHDPLRDDGARYGELLAAAGTPAEVHNATTMVHGYLGYAGVVPAATAGMERGLAALRNALYG